MSNQTQIITYRYRVKDKHAATLNRMAQAVNLVWNYANDAQKHALKWNQKWPSGFALTYMVSGASSELNIPQTSLYAAVLQYAKSRSQHRKPFLRYRGRKSLGWIPFKATQVRASDAGFLFYGITFSSWVSRELPAGRITDGGSFSQDATGRWYINIPVEVPAAAAHERGKFVGIDLGLKDLAVLSNGQRIEAPRLYRRSEQQLAIAQRARKKRRVTKIHAKIKAQRRDFLHKTSTKIADQFGFIAVGNVSPSKLVKTRMAKSVNDAGWADFKDMLAYKSRLRGGVLQEVNEAYTTQSCSSCGSVGSGPKGRKGLNIRQWECVECGAVHDRDVNSAILIARVAHDTLAAGAAEARRCEQALADALAAIQKRREAA